MRKNFGSQSWLYPMPVLIVATYDADGNANAMNAAWGGIHDTNMLGVCIDPGHKSAENLKISKAFTVSIGDAAHVVECDYLGIVSGKNEPDKLKRANLHTEKSAFVNAPVIVELPMALECKLVSFDEKTGCAVGMIVNVSADESVLDENGKISPEKFEPLTFDPVHHLYRKLGEIAGKAFADGASLKQHEK